MGNSQEDIFTPPLPTPLGVISSVTSSFIRPSTITTTPSEPNPPHNSLNPPSRRLSRAPLSPQQVDPPSPPYTGGRSERQPTLHWLKSSLRASAENQRKCCLVINWRYMVWGEYHQEKGGRTRNQKRNWVSFGFNRICRERSVFLFHYFISSRFSLKLGFFVSVFRGFFVVGVDRFFFVYLFLLWGLFI